MNNKLLIIIFVFLSGCGGGSLTPGVGETDKFAPLIEKINQDINLKANFIDPSASKNNFVKFKINRIESIEQTIVGSGNISIPNLRINEFFDKAEVFKAEVEITDDSGESIIVTSSTYMFATQGNYYSESEFPIEKLLVAVEFPFWRNGESILSIVYYQYEDLTMEKVLNERIIEKTGTVHSHEFQNYTFDIYQNNVGFLGQVPGSGSIVAERLNTFPRF
jgi:hypothetical protein